MREGGEIPRQVEGIAGGVGKGVGDFGEVVGEVGDGLGLASVGVLGRGGVRRIHRG